MEQHIDELIKRYPVLETNRNSILCAYEMMKACFNAGGKLLVAGNGGSAADAEHIVSELMKGFILQRKVSEDFCQELKIVHNEMGSELSQKLQGALPTIALNNHSSLNTAILNDVDGDILFAQQVLGYGNKGDILLTISTSGNSRDILYAAVTAKAKGVKVIALTGNGGGRLSEFADVCIMVSESETYRIQELHLPIYHCLCRMLETFFWGEPESVH